MSAMEANMPPKTNFKTSLRSHNELSGTKLLIPEVHSLSKVLENCICQIENVAVLPALIQLNSVSRVVDKELSGKLHKHQALSDRLETLEGLGQGSNGGQEDTFGEERAQLEEDIKNSVRNLLRLVRANPKAIFGLRAEQDLQVRESESTLIRDLKTFHRIVMEKFQTSVDEDLEQALLSSASPSRSHRQDLIHIKWEKLTTCIMELKGKIAERNEEINNLHIELDEKIQEEVQLTLQAKKQSRPQAKTFKMKQLQQEIDQLQMTLNSPITENRQTERAIQEKNEMLKTETKCLLQTFDVVMTEIQANLEINQKEYQRELEDFKKLEEPFSVLEEEFIQIQEKLRLEEEKSKQEMMELQQKTKAALYAQAWWRGYRTRKALKNKTKKAKKGKGKKPK